MKKTLFLLLFCCQSLVAQTPTDIRNPLFKLGTIIYKVDFIKADVHGPITSGSGFCTKIEKEGQNWRVYVLTANHVGKFMEHKYGESSFDLNTQITVSKFYPVWETFVIDKFAKKVSDKDTCLLSYITSRKPSDIPIPLATEDPEPGDELVMFGCAEGRMPTIKLCNFVFKQEGKFYIAPHSKGGWSGSVVVNMAGECVGIVSLSNNNFTVLESLVKEKK